MDSFNRALSAILGILFGAMLAVLAAGAFGNYLITVAGAM